MGNVLYIPELRPATHSRLPNRRHISVTHLPRTVLRRRAQYLDYTVHGVTAQKVHSRALIIGQNANSCHQRAVRRLQ